MTAPALSSSRPAVADVLRGPDATVAAQVLGVVGFALLAAFGAQVRVYLWEVPVTLQIAVYGAGLFLGTRNGLLSMALYLAMGLVFPVFAGAGYGLDYLATSASAGYLLSYPLVAALVGALSERWNSLWGAALSGAVGMAVLLACGTVWLHYAAGHATWWESAVKGALLFVVWDLAKVWLVAGGYAGLRRLTARA